MENFDLVQNIIIFAVPLLFAITVHETAHGWVAKLLGDSTASLMGRLTLNPIKHIDPIGTILVPVLFLILPGNFMFGWAKPVPVDWRNLGNPKRDMALVAVAGPVSNLLMAIIWMLLMKLVLSAGLGQPSGLLYNMCYAGILFNVILMLLNLLPILPLDGGRVLVGLLPVRLALAYSRTEAWGLWIVLGLAATGLLGVILHPMIASTLRFLERLLNF